jgi:membrane protease YdiL (CAAX protease family)
MGPAVISFQEVDVEILIVGVVFFVIALVARRKEAFRFRWLPTPHTWVAVGTGLLAFGFSALMLLFEPGSVPVLLIHNGLIYVVCGAAIPWGYTILVERNGPAALGLKRERWVLSLILSLVAASLFVPVLFFEGDLASIGWGNVAKASFILTGAGGLFEVFLYCGFVHLRLEKAFGTIPAILLTSAIYVLWHVGTQLPLEPDPLYAMWKLFWVGVMFQSLFSLTHNLLVIWPLFHAVGVMLDFAVNIGAVDAVVGDLPWAAGAVVLMVVVSVGLIRVRERLPGDSTMSPSPS